MILVFLFELFECLLILWKENLVGVRVVSVIELLFLSYVLVII